MDEWRAMVESDQAELLVRDLITEYYDKAALIYIHQSD